MYKNAFLFLRIQFDVESLDEIINNGVINFINYTKSMPTTSLLETHDVLNLAQYLEFDSIDEKNIAEAKMTQLDLLMKNVKQHDAVLLEINGKTKAVMEK